MLDPQRAFKNLIRKTGLVKKLWFHRYERALKNKSNKKEIDLINKLDLYERKNIINPIINRVIWVKLDDINQVYFNKEINKPLEKNYFYNNFIADGDWDLNKVSIFPDYFNNKNHIGAIGFRTIYQLFEDNYDIEDTDEYKAKIDKYDHRKLKKEFMSYNDTFDKIKSKGYKTQVYLKGELQGRKIYDEIRVAIDRNGDYNYICSSGNHRLAMVKILGLDEIPVIVDGVHKSWLDLDNNLLGEINNKLLAIEK